MSDFLVSARKYRPQRFADVLGQEHVTRTLKNALLRNQMAHAFLFTGPRGVGKTTCARILAKVINCENALKNQDAEPCNVCESCRKFDEQITFNIIEIDAASNNSVEGMRNLIEQVRYLPQQGKYKVFIIDEVHMLSNAAFNAFLKTLEEPPAHAIFILATTERHKIIPTILSRCQVYDFRRIQPEEIVKQLQQVAKDQEIETEADALHIIAHKVDGSMRDALSIFDRIASFGGKQVTYAGTISNLNVLDHEYFFNLVYGMLREDSMGTLKTFRDIHQLGFEGNHFMDGLADHLRNLLVSKDPGAVQLIEGSQDLKTKYHAQAQSAPVSFILDALAIANECDLQYERARNKRLHVELALIRMCYLHRLTDAVPASLQEPEKKKPEPGPAQPQVIISPQPPVHLSVFDQEPVEIPRPAAPAEQSVPNNYNTPKIRSLKDIQKKAAQSIQANPDSAVELKIETFEQAWKEFVNTVEVLSLKSVLNQVELVLEQTKLLIKVASTHARNIIQLESSLLEKLRNSVSDKRLEIAIVIDPEKAKQLESQIKKPVSLKEKYDLMVQTNPKVEDLILALKLRIDHG